VSKSKGNLAIGASGRCAAPAVYAEVQKRKSEERRMIVQQRVHTDNVDRQVTSGDAEVVLGCQCTTRERSISVHDGELPFFPSLSIEEDRVDEGGDEMKPGMLLKPRFTNPRHQRCRKHESPPPILTRNCFIATSSDSSLPMFPLETGPESPSASVYHSLFPEPRSPSKVFRRLFGECRD